MGEFFGVGKYFDIESFYLGIGRSETRRTLYEHYVSQAGSKSLGGKTCSRQRLADGTELLDPYRAYLRAFRKNGTVYPRLKLASSPGRLFSFASNRKHSLVTICITNEEAAAHFFGHEGVLATLETTFYEQPMFGEPGPVTLMLTEHGDLGIYRGPGMLNSDPEAIDFFGAHASPQVQEYLDALKAAQELVRRAA